MLWNGHGLGTWINLEPWRQVRKGVTPRCERRPKYDIPDFGSFEKLEGGKRYLRFQNHKIFELEISLLIKINNFR